MDYKERLCKIILEKNDLWYIRDKQNIRRITIKTAYRKLTIKFYPYKNKATSLEEALKKANQIFSVLSDKNKRTDILQDYRQCLKILIDLIYSSIFIKISVIKWIS